MEDSGIDSDPKAVNHIEDERLFLVNIHLNKHIDKYLLLDFPNKEIYETIIYNCEIKIMIYIQDKLFNDIKRS